MEHVTADCCTGTVQNSASSLFFTLISALITSKSTFSYKNQYPADYGRKLHDGDSFDFIIVGAGSAGSIVANRLSENPKWKVLLVEAGGYPSANSEIPSLTLHLQNSDENWKYQCELSEYERSLKKKRCPRGKGLGGSSLINFMIYFRGNRYDYDGWAQAGNEGWDFDSVLPYYKKFENFQSENTDRFGKNGELHFTKAVETNPVLLKIKEAYKSLGYYDDYHEEKPVGTLSTFFSKLNGRRYNTAKAFLGKNIKNRPNLYVTLNAQVWKLLINEKSIVNGVELQLKNKLLKIYANNEVILSAGSVNSPQILMNSGIGPKRHLESLGIKVIKNLKVGENLLDHVAVSGIYYKLNVSVPSNVNDLDNIYEYFMHGKGQLSEMGFTSIGIINTNSSKTPYAQIYQNFYPKNYFNHPQADIIGDIFDLPEDVIQTTKEANSLSPLLELLPVLTYPKSKGRILLKSNNPFDVPLIYPNYLNDAQDVLSAIESIRFIQKLMKTKSLEIYDPKMVKSNLKDCQKYTFDTDDYWDCFIRHLIHTAYHISGTCKMGPETDPDAVVDSRLRVHGLKRIRVIDSSIMPSIVGVNTNGPTIVIGEKGADMVKEDWKTKNVKL